MMPAVFTTHHMIRSEQKDIFSKYNNLKQKLFYY